MSGVVNVWGGERLGGERLTIITCGIGKPGQEDDDIGGGDEDVVGGRGEGDVEPCNFSIWPGPGWAPRAPATNTPG